MNSNTGFNSGVMANEIKGDVNININNNIKKLPSIMPKFIEILAELIDEEDENMINNTGRNIYDIYDIEEKIKYNNLSTYKEIVNDYGEYYYVCNTALDNVNEAYSSGKRKILREISEMYKAEKRIILSRNKEKIDAIYIIRNNADRIIDTIKNLLIDKIRILYTEENIIEEDLNYCASVFVCYCFVECKILEKPPM